MRKNVSTGEREVADEMSMWGNVELDATLTSPYFLGATVGSNNTGELIGIAQGKHKRASTRDLAERRRRRASTSGDLLRL
jgi:hypothetical protein